MSEVPPAVFLTDPKNETFPTLERGWHENGVDVQRWAPMCEPGKYFANVDFNLLEAPIDCYWSDDHEYRNTATFLRSQLSITNPPPPPGAQNEFFTNGGRSCAMGISGALIIDAPERATFPEVYRIASDPKEARDLIKRAAAWKNSDTDSFSNDIARSCRTVLELCTGKNEHHFVDFLKHVSDPLIAFDQTGFLGETGKFATARISDIRKGTKPKVIVCGATLSHLRDYENPLTLFTNAVFLAIKGNPTGRGVHCLLDEFLVMNLKEYPSEQTTLRGLGCTAEIYTQSRQALVERTSPESAATIENQSDIKIFAGIDDWNDAKEISDMLGSSNQKDYDANFDEDFGSVRFGFKDTDVPLMSPQQLMAMPHNEQIIKIRGMRPIRCRKIPIWDVAGVREFLDENPLEGPLPKTNAKAQLQITKHGVRLLAPKPPKQFKDKEERNDRSLTDRQTFLWLPVFGAMLLAYIGGFMQYVQWPALRVNYTYYGSDWYAPSAYEKCWYIALNGWFYVKKDGVCPLVMLDDRSNH